MIRKLVDLLVGLLIWAYACIFISASPDLVNILLGIALMLTTLAILWPHVAFRWPKFLLLIVGFANLYLLLILAQMVIRCFSWGYYEAMYVQITFSIPLMHGLLYLSRILRIRLHLENKRP